MERGPRRVRPAVLSALALAAPMSLATLPASAAPPTFVYDALGDSYAAGFGLPPGQAHPRVLDGRMRIVLDDLAAVPGASVASLQPQLAALDAGTDLVTLSIGGNDIPWISVVAACGIGTEAECARLLGAAEAAIDQDLPVLLDLAYTQVRATAPAAHVVVTGYPRLFSPEFGDFTGTVNLPPFGELPFHVSVTEQKVMNGLADRLNAAIAGAAVAHGFQYVDVAGRFAGHGVNATEPWIGGPDDPEQLHPTVEGQQAYGVALRAAIRPSDLR